MGSPISVGSSNDLREFECNKHTFYLDLVNKIIFGKLFLLFQWQNILVSSFLTINKTLFLESIYYDSPSGQNQSLDFIGGGYCFI